MNKMKTEIGRPCDFSNRLPKEQRVYDLLDELKIEYVRADHEQADTMEACIAIEEALDVKMCKNLFLRNEQKTSFYLLIMPGDKKFKTKDLSKQIQSARLSFAEPEFMEKYLDITPGSVSVTGLMNDKEKNVRFLCDLDILQNEFVGIHPSINTSSLKIRTEDMKKLVEATGHSMTVVQL